MRFHEVISPHIIEKERLRGTLAIVVHDFQARKGAFIFSVLTSDSDRSSLVPVLL